MAAIQPKRKARRKNLYLFGGLFIIGIYLILVFIGEFIIPYDSDDQNLLLALAPPSADHWFGTDELGRDVLSRIIIGVRYTAISAISSVFLAALIGVTVGAIAGFFGGRIDLAITVVIDLFLTIPLLILAIAIASVVGAGLLGLIVATSLSFTPPLARLIRGRTMEIREEEYVQAARILGLSDSRVIFRHVLLNAMTVICIETTLLAGQAILVGTALGFLGLGPPPPAPEWGVMLSRGREYMEIAPHLVIAPGIAISLMVMGFNLLGDGLRDLFDPRSDI